MNENVKLYHGDCLEVMDKLIVEGVKVDAIITDPPYGTTACKWDSVIPFDAMWGRLKKLRNNNTPIVLFGSEPFSSALRMSNIKEYKYDWKWRKNKVGNVFNCKNSPLKIYEDVICFSKGSIANGSNIMMSYNPQGLIEINKNKNDSRKSQDTTMGHRPSRKGNYIQKFTKYPLNIIEFNCEHGLRPTQKPVDLLEYLIKTYTNEGDTVLDFTMGSGTTGVACINTNRNFIGIELDETYFNIAKERIEKAEAEVKLSAK